MNRAVIWTRELGYVEVCRSNVTRAGRSLGSRQAGAERGRSRGNCEGPESKSQGNSSPRTGELCSRQGGEHGTGSVGKPGAGVRRFRPNQADRSPPQAGENRSDELFVDVRIRESDNFTAHQLNGIGFNISEEWIGALLLCGLLEEYRSMIMALENSGIRITGDAIKTKLLQEVQIPSADAVLL